MRRSILQPLKSWLYKSDRKPLVLRGARQVGKTYAVEDFADQEILGRGGSYHYIDLKEDREYHSIFAETNNPQKIIELIELEKGVAIDLEKDLLFLDEIQECGDALSSLKYFEQNMKELAVIVAGSHLGMINTQSFFPVGKVNFLSMFPMTFLEFVEAIEPKLLSYLQEWDPEERKPLPTVVHQKLLQQLSYYLAVGGLPEAVQSFLDSHKGNLLNSLEEVRKIQSDLLAGYMADFSRYAGTVNANHIQHVFESIPKQLSRVHDESVNKYKFSGVIPNQNGFARIAGPLSWLCKSRLCIKNFVANKAEHPLSSYSKDNFFKVFFFDVGLLHAALNTPIESIVTNGLGDYKGYIAENFVAQELYAYTTDHKSSELYSWREGTAELEFLTTQGKNIVPIEVKSSSRWSRAKSLSAFINRYHRAAAEEDSSNRAYKLTAQNVGEGKGFVTLPMYLVHKIVNKS